MILILSLILSGSPADAAERTVGTGGEDFTTIQAAINASSDGDTISVSPGAYPEHIDFLGRNLAIESTLGASATWVTGDGATPTIIFENGESPETRLQGFTVRGDGEHCIEISGGSSPHLSDLLIENCGFLDESNGGGMHISGGSTTLDNVTFSNNQALHGAGVAITDFADVLIENCTFNEGSAEYGGAIHITNSTVAIQDSTLESNQAIFGSGGAIYGTSATVSVMGGRMSSNEATNNGGAIRMMDSDLTLSSLDAFNENTAVYGSGGGLSIESTSSLNIWDSELTNNSAGTDGGAVHLYADGGEIMLSGVTLRGNSSGDAGGALWMLDASVTLNDCTIDDNTASGRGGGVYSGHASGLNLSGSTITGNVSGDSGGGIFSADDAVVLVTNSTFTSNEALEDGGGLCVWADTATFSGVTLQANRATAGRGGGANVHAPVGTFHEITVRGNEAARGGGLYIDCSLSAQVDWSLIQENTSTYEGGGILLQGTGMAEVWNNDFLANQTLTSGLPAGIGVDGPATVFSNNIVAWSIGGHGIFHAGTESVGVLNVRYGMVWANDDGHYGGGIGDRTGEDGNLEADPLLLDASFDGDFTNDDLHLTEDSPCIDADDPAITPPEGRTGHIGAFGVGDAPLPDEDEDGFTEATDCDDTDPTIHPDAPEVCFDEVDNNCDGQVDEDCEGLIDTGQAEDDTGHTSDPDDTGSSPGDDTGQDDRGKTDTGSNPTEKSDLYKVSGSGCHCQAGPRWAAGWFLALLIAPLVARRRIR